MALDKVKQEILDEAEEEAEQIIEEAENEAEDIVSEAKQQAEQIRDEAEEEAENKAASLRKQELASARMEAQQKKMDAKQEIIHEAFDQLAERVSDMDEDSQAELFESVIKKVSDEMEIGTVLCSSDMASHVKEMVDADVETSDIEGIILENKDGSVRYDYSFDSVLENVRNQHRKDVASELFG